MEIIEFKTEIYVLQDECSFVSLRDVERAMIVFEWFYDKAKIIEVELKKQEGYKVQPLWSYTHMYAICI